MGPKLTAEAILGVLLGLNLAACEQKPEAKPEAEFTPSAEVQAPAEVPSAPSTAAAADPSAAPVASAEADDAKPADTAQKIQAKLKPAADAPQPAPSAAQPAPSAQVSAKEVSKPKAAPSASGKQMACAAGKCGAGSCG